MKSHASMNRIYRLVWNAALNLWVAVAENAKGRSKGGSGRSSVSFTSLSSVLTALALLAPPWQLTYAADAANAAVVAGGGTVATAGNTTTINQSTNRLAIDWTSLSTRANEALVFNQPSAQAIALNRITGTSPSELLGSLTANGQVFILNPNGILFGAGSQVNVGGLVASTLNMSNADFMAGNNVFTGNGSRASVVNQGTMTAASGGYLALLAPEVRNEGVMVANLGTALLAAGNKVTLNLNNGSLLSYSIDQGAVNALAENKQLIKADGGQVLLSARAMDALTTATVNNTGIIEAKTIQNRSGRIMLMGDMAHGTVNVGGTLDASASNTDGMGGNGGFIETSAANVKVTAGTQVTTRAAAGQTGSWLIDPADYNISASGGDISGATLSANLVNTSVSILSSGGSQAAGGGDINVNDAVSWSANTLTLTAARDINFNAVATATGSAGLVMNTATANGASAAVPGGRVNMALGAGGFTGRVDMATGTSLSINGEAYTIVNSVGAEGVFSANDLQGMYGNQNARFALGSNIDATVTSGWNGGAGFAGMPNYKGRFNGLGHTITGLTINTPTADEVGLFGKLQSNGYTRIANVGLVGGSVTGRNYVGALVGWAQFNSGAVISNSYSTAAVNGSNFVGGLVGAYSSSNLPDNTGIFNSYATGAVTGTNTDFQRIGGLVGSAALYSSGGVLIGNSYATGTVTAGGTNSMAGGLVGEAGMGNISGSYATGQVNGAGAGTIVGGLIGEQTDTVVSTSYATGEVRGGSANGGGPAGGLVGRLESGSIANSYASGTVAATGTGTTGAFYIGGLVGYASGFASSVSSITNSYATGAVSGPTFVGGLLGGKGNGSVTISGSYASGTVTGLGTSGARGGLIGAAASAGSVAVNDSYSTGNVSGIAGYSGGLIGLSETSTTISNSYASNVVSGGGTRGGLAGYSTGTLSNNFWNSDTATTAFGIGDAANNTGTVPLTTAQFKQSATFTSAGLSASNVGGDGTTWRIYEGQTGPLLRSLLTPLNLVLDYDGSGTTLTNIGSYTIPGGTNASQVLGVADMTRALTLSSSGTAGNYIASVDTGRHSTQAGYDISATRSIATPGSAAGTVRLDNGLTWTNGTLNINAANNIDLNNKSLTATTGGLALTAGAAINNAGTVNVGTFDLQGGIWNQVAATLPTFNATDFRISGGTFIRTQGGVGSLASPFQIADVYGLQGIGSAGMSGNQYVQANNIDAAGTANWNGGAGFRPIGRNSAFSGTFDGANKSISNLTINRSTENNVALFGQLASGATIKNVGLVNVSVSGQNFVGALAGLADGNANITNSYATGNVTGLARVGGLVGYIGTSSNNVVSNSYATTSVTGQNNVGGLVGMSFGGISDSYATGSVTGAGVGNNSVGGLVGGNSGNLSNSYATGLATSGLWAGALVGRYAGSDNITASFWLDGATPGIGNNTATGTVDSFTRGLNTAEFKTAATFTSAGWNASKVGGDGTTWRIYEGQTGPLLRGLMTGLTLADTTLTYNGGTQQGATTADSRILGGNNASARNAGSYGNSYYSNQQGVDVIGGALNIGKANLTLTTSDVTKTYDGDLSASGTAVATAGTQLFGTDTASGGSFAFADKNFGVGNKTVTANAVTVNDGNSGNNYNVSYVDNTSSTINKAALTVTANAVTKTYDGNTSATGNGTVGALAGAAAGEAVNSAGVQAFLDKNAGTGNKVVRASGVTIKDSGNVDVTGNYDVSYADNTSSTINRANLTLASSNLSKTYDGGLSASGTAIATAGTQLFGTDSASGGSFAFTDKNFGLGNKTVTASGVTVNDGNGGNNYNVSYVDNTSSTINNANLTLTTSDVIKTYDGGLSASGTAIVTAGTLLFGTDTASGGSFAFTDKNFGLRNKTVTTSGVTVNDGNSGNNYNVSYVDNTSSTINKAALTVTANAVTKTYDGNTTATGSGTAGTLAGAAAGEAINSAGTQAFLDKNAVSGNKVVRASGVTIKDSGNVDVTGNYTVSYADNTSSTINRASLTLASSNVIKTYDGGLSATGTAIAAAGTQLFGTDTASGGSFAFTDKNFGLGNKTVTASGVTVNDGNSGNNYNVSYVDNTSSTINKALLTVTANAVTKTYDGNTTATGNGTAGTLAGAAAGEAVNSAGSQAFLDKNAGSGNKSVRASGVTIQDSGNVDVTGNYNVSYVDNTTSTINQASLTVTANGINKVYDGNTTAQVSYTDNRVAGDTLVISSNASYLDKNVANGKTVNVTGIALSSTDAGNYTLSGTTAATTANITPKALSVTANNDSRVAGGAPYSGGNGVDYNGFVAGEKVANLAGLLAYSGTSQGASAAGSYAITPGGLTASNYTLGFTSGVLSINAAAVQTTSTINIPSSIAASFSTGDAAVTAFQSALTSALGAGGGAAGGAGGGGTGTGGGAAGGDSGAGAALGKGTNAGDDE